MAGPISDLFFRTIEIQKKLQPCFLPTNKRRECAPKRNDAFGGAGLHGRTGKPPLHISDLNRIYINRYDFMMMGKLHCRAACRRNAENSSARWECTELNCRVLVHASEKQFVRSAARIEPAAFPGCCRNG